MQMTSKPGLAAAMVLVLGGMAGMSQAEGLYFLGAVGAGPQLGNIQLVNDDGVVRLGASRTVVQPRQDVGFKPTLGYQLNSSFALESAYADAKSTEPTFYGLGFVPVSDQFSVFGKLGSTRSVGLGGIYQLGTTWGLRAEWERTTSSVNLHQFTLGLQARF